MTEVKGQLQGGCLLAAGCGWAEHGEDGAGSI